MMIYGLSASLGYRITFHVLVLLRYFSELLNLHIGQAYILQVLSYTCQHYQDFQQNQYHQIC
jgi:hypothetical protein